MAVSQEAQRWWQRAGPVRIAIAAAYVGALAAILLPLLTARVPALADYPNHLARMHILSEQGGNGALGDIYRVQWSLVPNLAMDLLVPPLTAVFGLYTAGKIFLAAIIILTVTGCAVLQAALFGRLGLWPLAVLPFMYNYILGLGFLSYLFGAALVPFVVAAWIKTEHWSGAIRLALFTIAATLLFICHLGAVAIYGVCVLAMETHRWRAGSAVAALDFGKRLVAAAGQFLVPGALFLLTWSGGEQPGFMGYNWSTKLTLPLTPGLFYRAPADFLIAEVAAVVVCALVILGAVRLTPRLRMPVAILALLAVFLPTWFAGNWGNDVRLVPPLVVLAVAGCQFTPSRRCFGPLLALSVVALTVFRLLMLVDIWPKYDKLYNEIIAVGGTLEPGARVLPARADGWAGLPGIAPIPYPELFYNVPALLVLGGPVFVPTIFTEPGKQVIQVREAYAEFDKPHGRPLSIARLRRDANPGASDRISANATPASRVEAYPGWPESFDYVLLLDFGDRKNPLPAHLEPARVGSYFTLYRVRSAGAGRAD